MKCAKNDPLQFWQERKLSNRLLLPLSGIFAGASLLRRHAYRRQWLASGHPGVPVIVVGNIFVGGTGKTPLVIFLLNWLKTRGLNPGVVSRGYGIKKQDKPRLLDVHSLAAEVGDEPLLIWKKTNAPVVVAANRLEGAIKLVQECACNVIIADDGLQHYRLQRDIEIAITDAMRGLGNGWLLPAGPLREPPKRLDHVDWALINGGQGGEDSFRLELKSCYNLLDTTVKPLSFFQNKKVHAVAGIGNPARFFNSLKSASIDVIAHAFPDHHSYRLADISFADSLPILITEKDAVKLAPLLTNSCDLPQADFSAGVWAVEASLSYDDNFVAKLERLLREKAVLK